MDVSTYVRTQEQIRTYVRRRTYYVRTLGDMDVDHYVRTYAGVIMLVRMYAGVITYVRTEYVSSYVHVLTQTYAHTYVRRSTYVRT